MCPSDIAALEKPNWPVKKKNAHQQLATQFQVLQPGNQYSPASQSSASAPSGRESTKSDAPICCATLDYNISQWRCLFTRVSSELPCKHLLRITISEFPPTHTRQDVLSPFRQLSSAPRERRLLKSMPRGGDGLARTLQTIKIAIGVLASWRKAERETSNSRLRKNGQDVADW